MESVGCRRSPLRPLNELASALSLPRILIAGRCWTGGPVFHVGGGRAAPNFTGLAVLKLLLRKLAAVSIVQLPLSHQDLIPGRP